MCVGIARLSRTRFLHSVDRMYDHFRLKMRWIPDAPDYVRTMRISKRTGELRLGTTHLSFNQHPLKSSNELKPFNKLMIT